MEIYKSKVMGFCYGVRRAIKIADSVADSGIKAVTLGPIIHNPQVVKRLAQKGGSSRKRSGESYGQDRDNSLARSRAFVL